MISFLTLLLAGVGTAVALSGDSDVKTPQDDKAFLEGLVSDGFTVKEGNIDNFVACNDDLISLTYQIDNDTSLVLEFWNRGGGRKCYVGFAGIGANIQGRSQPQKTCEDAVTEALTNIIKLLQKLQNVDSLKVLTNVYA